MFANASPSKSKRGRILNLATRLGCLTVLNSLASDDVSTRANHFQRRLLMPYTLLTDKFAPVSGLEVLALSRLSKSRSTL